MYQWINKTKIEYLKLVFRPLPDLPPQKEEGRFIMENVNVGKYFKETERRVPVGTSLGLQSPCKTGEEEPEEIRVGS